MQLHICIFFLTLSWTIACDYSFWLNFTVNAKTFLKLKQFFVLFQILGSYRCQGWVTMLKMWQNAKFPTAYLTPPPSEVSRRKKKFGMIKWGLQNLDMVPDSASMSSQTVSKSQFFVTLIWSTGESSEISKPKRDRINFSLVSAGIGISACRKPYIDIYSRVIHRRL